MATASSRHAEDVLFEALLRSLANLGIDSTRFRSLPAAQRTLSIKQAVTATAAHITKDIHWFADRAEFGEKSISHYSTESIAQHQVIVDALISLVCLGETLAINPLVTYLGFPERRWSILIEPILRAVNSSTLSEPIYRLPTANDLTKWRLLGAKQRLTRKRTAAEPLISMTGPQLAYSSLNMSISGLRNMLTHDVGVSYDSYDETHNIKDHPSLVDSMLASGDEIAFVKTLNDYLNRHSPTFSHEALAACIRDNFGALNISIDRARQRWLKSLHKDEIAPRTWVMLFDITTSAKDDVSWVKAFVDKISGGRMERSAVKALYYVLAPYEYPASAEKLFKTYIELDNLRLETRNVFSQLVPHVTGLLYSTVWNRIVSEGENACIVGSGPTRDRSRLWRETMHQITKNDKLFLLAGLLADSKISLLFRLGKYIRNLQKRRMHIWSDQMLPKPEKTELVCYEYDRLLDDWSQLKTDLTKADATALARSSGAEQGKRLR